MTAKNFEINMSEGPLLKKIVAFVIPLILSGILQLLYNAADIVVVGQFAGNAALAAVGSTGSLINLIVNLLIGLSIGTSVTVAHFYGAGKSDEVSDTVHTSISISVIGGFLFGLFGFFMAEDLLKLMGSPDDVLPQAALYLKIYFAGLPATMLYNFGSSILRAIGDTKRPLYFLTIAGIVNVALNLLFVIEFDMGAGGVALATVIAQCISAFLIILSLIRTPGACRLYIKQLRITKDKLFQIIRIGIPAGLQSTFFSISNVIIQSSVNSFGSIVIAGNSAASNIEGFVYASMNAVYQAALTFTGQNVGAQKYNRINKIFWICLILSVGVGAILGNAAYFFGETLLSIYTPDAQVVSFGLIRLSIIATSYFLCGAMEVFVGMLRGMGKSLMPMIVTVFGACILRLVWIYTVFAVDRSLFTLYLSYPISWAVTILMHLVCYILVKRKLTKRSVLPPII